MSKPKALMAVPFCCYLLAGFALAAAPAGDVKDWVDRKVADCEPKVEERRFDLTGWVPDIRTALKLAKEHRRPVFLFTHDGHIHVGRC